MERRSPETTEAVELNIVQILNLLLRGWWVIVLCTALSVGGAFGASKFLIQPQYTSSVLFYVNNLSFAEDNRISGSDMDASKSLVQTYMVILNTNRTLDLVIDRAGVDLTAEQVADMLSAAAVEQTQILQVTVTGPDAAGAGRLAEAIGEVFPERVRSIMVGCDAVLAEPVQMPTRPSSPNVLRNMVSGFLFGFVLGCSLVLLRRMFDVTIRSEKQLAEILNCPLLARIPELSGDTGSQALVGHRLKPPVQEAYKTLRTGLEYTLTDQMGCRVVGVSSAMAGEGKSTSAANLAYTMSQLNRRVLLLECDLRRPSLHKKISISPGPGLSEILSGQAEPEAVIRCCNLRGGSFSAIRAGRVPPNPGELLNSHRMKTLVQQLREQFDYIIVDLPPVGEVSDALTVAKYTDGTLLVVRRNYCSSLWLRSALKQFEAVDARLLGVLLNCAEM